MGLVRLPIQPLITEKPKTDPAPQRNRNRHPAATAAPVPAKLVLDKRRLLMQIPDMRYPVMLERIPDVEGMPGYYYAYVRRLA